MHSTDSTKVRLQQQRRWLPASTKERIIFPLEDVTPTTQLSSSPYCSEPPYTSGVWRVQDLCYFPSHTLRLIHTTRIACLPRKTDSSRGQSNTHRLPRNHSLSHWCLQRESTFVDCSGTTHNLPRHYKFLAPPSLDQTNTSVVCFWLGET